MSAPSLATLTAHLTGQLGACHSDESEIIQCVHMALQSHARGEWTVEETLEECDRLLETHGVENLSPSIGDRPIAAYCNAGDTYDVTILYSFRTSRFYVTDWGSWYERTPEYRAYDRESRRAYG
jgi:hypothetical protein